MTKRVLATWFCKTIGIMGMISTIFQVLPWIGLLLGYPPIANPLSSILHLGMSLFIWLLAPSIGSELAAEGEYGDPIKSLEELRPMVWRCAGFLLFIYGAQGVSQYVISIGITGFSASNTVNSTYRNMMIPGLISFFVQVGVGFILAFGPRIRQAFR